jgi:hypothetical protein
LFSREEPTLYWVAEDNQSAGLSNTVAKIVHFF